MVTTLIDTARSRWDDLPGDVKVVRTQTKRMRFPVMSSSVRPIWNRDLSWDLAYADMTLHPEHYTLERQMKIREKVTPAFGMIEVELEPIGDYWLGYCEQLNILCYWEDNALT